MVTKALEKAYKTSKEKSFLYLFVTGIAIVTFWRGVWGLQDIFLFPGNPAVSYMFSFVIGGLILYFNDRKFNEI